MKKYTESIKRSSAVGLWGSAAAVILAALFHYLSPWRFYPSQHTARWMLIAGAVLAVLALAMSLLVIRKQIPALRQNESLEAKLSGYAQHIRSLYLSMLTVVVLICIFAILSAQNVLLMLAMVATLMLILAYPNIYRIKVELGLTDEEMKTLFGDKYISDNPDAKQ
jgi:hypothetical protein